MYFMRSVALDLECIISLCLKALDCDASLYFDMRLSQQKEQKYCIHSAVSGWGWA